MSEFETVRKLDLGGMEQREQRRAVKKQEQEQQKAQQVDAVEAVRRGFQGHLAEMQRQISLKRLQSDPMLAFFVLANRDFGSA
jgi:hypothetical protein